MKSQEKELLSGKGKKALDTIENLSKDSITYLEGFLAGTQVAIQASEQKEGESQSDKEETKADGSGH